MNNEEVSTIYCIKCGAEMKSNSRCCMKCGTLNPEHPDNANMLKYIDKKQTGYQVGSGMNLSLETSSNDITTVVGRNTGNFTACFIVNLLLYLLIIGFICYFSGTFFSWNINMLFASNTPVILIIISIGFLWTFGKELLFMKMNQKWWYSLVPVYNNMILAKSVFNNMWLGLLVLIPVVGQIFFLVMLYKLAIAFKKSGILMILFPLIMVLIIGYGTSSFNNKNFVSESDGGLEKEYGKKKFFLSLCIFFIIVSIGAYIYSNIDNIKNNKDIINKTYLYTLSKYYIARTEMDLKKIKEKCDVNNSVIFSRSSNSSFFNNKIDTYIRMVKRDDNIYFYISMSDGKYGYSETLISELTFDKIVEYCKLDADLQGANYCNY